MQRLINARTLALSIISLNSVSLHAGFDLNRLQGWWSQHGALTVKDVATARAQRAANNEVFEFFEPVLPLLPAPPLIPYTEDQLRDLLEVPDSVLINDFRIDASLAFDRAYFEVKPRMKLTKEYFERGPKDGDERSDTDWYINEWVAQVFVLDDLSLSYGREDLQWGPSFLLSPSNPFDSFNGREDPKTEVDGADYVKLVWTPDYSWTFSLIANTSEGLKENQRSFEEIYAFKVDYLFDRGNVSAILSTTDEKKPEVTTGDYDTGDRLGAYLSYNLTDAFIGYVEGSASEQDEEVLLGGSYTFNSGLSINVEYFYNSTGIDGYSEEPPVEVLSYLPELFEQYFNASNRETFLLQNYTLLQVFQSDVIGSLDTLGRFTYNWDDDSWSALGHLEFDLNDYMQVFASGTLFSDDKGELDALREYWVQIGLEFTY